MLNAKSRWTVFLLAALTLATLFSLQARPSADGPEIRSLNFPRKVDTRQTGHGTVSYLSEAGLSRLQFDVVDGRYRREDIQVTASAQRGQARFSLPCTGYAQVVTLRVTAWDVQGRASTPKLLRFSCGQPPRYNFSQVLSDDRPIQDQLRLNVFVLDDGITTLTEAAAPSERAFWKRPSAALVTALERDVLAALSGIWDQCGVGFELGHVRVLDPRALALGNQTLHDRLFSAHEGEPVILHGSRAGLTLRAARRELEGALADEGTPLTPRDLVAFVTGARVLSQTNGELADIEGFGEISTPTYALVRWGATYNQGESIVLPKQMVTTLAHELGHNLGLGHPESDGLVDTGTDANNLMKGSGVTPEPRARLLESQCRRVDRTLEEIETRMIALQSRQADAHADEGTHAQGAVSWVGLRGGATLSGTVELALATDGLALEGFGFAEFAYSPDGKRFVQIALDRTSEDGFRSRWDTAGLDAGRYLLRGTVTDAERKRASAALWVRVQ